MSTRRVLITGGGSGSGAATARLIARQHPVVLVGRREDRLRAVQSQITADGGDAAIVPFDVRTGSAVDLFATVGEVTDLVLAAGMNAPRRSWADHDLDEFEQIVDTNLTSVARLITAALPALRRRGGVVVVISSLAARGPADAAGVAYRASKTALRVLTESLNSQEARYGIRACHLCPGDIDTDFLQQRPEIPTAEVRSSMLAPEDVAQAVSFVLDVPRHVRIDELVISSVGTVAR